MKKILYLMSIDWYWIKQRPQILAEYLAKDYDVTVVYMKEIFCKQDLRKEKDELEKSYAIPAIPYRDKNIAAHSIQKMMFRKIMKMANTFDIIWVGHPLLYRYIPRNYGGKIIYDCMDNHEALCGDEKIKKTIRQTEADLIKRADRIFVSSTGLYKKVQNAGGEGCVFLVRNGFVADKIYPPVAVNHQKNENLKIGYFGTIAEWFDFPLLLKSLEKFPNLEYYLWGPVSGINVPNHPRIKLLGVVEHSRLWENVKDMDCLIMPFQVNDIIRDVDPVKLYEYISMGKRIISVEYDEIDRFGEFVYFYKNIFDYENIIGRMAESQIKYNIKEQKKFLLMNSWEKRYETIRKGIPIL